MMSLGAFGGKGPKMVNHKLNKTRHNVGIEV